MKRPRSQGSSPRLEELRFLYQPIVPLGGGNGWSEALVRWQLQDGTVKGPLEVLPHWLAPARLERFTRFTLELAARAAAANPEARVSVNLSPAQLLLRSTLTLFEGMLPAVRSRLHIELTEQVYIDGGALATRLRLLKKRCGIVLLDDVTPQDLESRLRYDSPVDGVKIDRSVVAALLGAEEENGLSRDKARRFVTEVTERFAVVVAEGIEDPNACEELAALGVSHVQGFGIARPAPELRSEASVNALAPAPERIPARTADATRSDDDDMPAPGELIGWTVR
ncbi:MAG: EAL domain-containing protein [Deinococcales bacterium]|nr:EAL domain-containing protein [Deinococcales bacterium]